MATGDIYFDNTIKRSFGMVSAVFSLMLLLTGCASNTLQPSNTVSPIEDIVLLQKEADQHFRNRTYEEALVKYVGMINLDPDNEHAYVHIGLIHEEMENYSLSEKAYSNALRINEKSIVAKEGMGISLLRQGRQAESKKLLESLVAQQPERWKAQNGLGVIYDMEQAQAKALTRYQLALKYNPNNEEILNNMGYSHYLRGDYRLAEENFLRAIQINHQYDRAWSNLGLLYARKLKYDESIIAFSNVMAPYEAHNQVGYLSMLFGEYEVSELHLKKAILMAPFYYETAHKNLGRLKILRSSL